FQECLSLAVVLQDRRLQSYARRWLDRLSVHAVSRPAWTEVRPGIWRPRAAPPHPASDVPAAAR
ncbi:hypothetical protein P8605_43055, partial [Streptomyces sp. T-3]|nr:hypothetical protein [Streptomyces sp. T-3]